ncbi:MAG: M24 family metallopeptidase [Deltaproteobacteria bacterium]
MIEKFLSLSDARKYSISQHELERRWKAVRERMATRGIDCLVVQSQQRYVGGYFRWFTDMPGANYPITAIFPLKEEMTIISHGPGAPAAPGNPPDWALRGVKEKINTPAFPNVWWEDAWDAEKAVEVIQRLKPKTVGFVGMGNISASLYDNINKGLRGVNIVNASDLVDEVRMVKSEEELGLHREAAYMHQMSYEVAKNAIRPGRTVSEVLTEIRFAQISAGSEEQQIAIMFGPLDSFHQQQHSWGNVYWRRKLKEGDIINLLIESSMPGGYWYDLRRFLSIGPVPQELQEAHAIAAEAKRIMAAHSKPGILPRVALDASNSFLKERGCPAEARIAAHGQGLDLVERPVYHQGEMAKFEVGMIVCLHPTAKTQKAMACLADTYVIAESGAVPLYRELFEDSEIAVVG